MTFDITIGPHGTWKTDLDVAIEILETSQDGDGSGACVGS